MSTSPSSRVAIAGASGFVGRALAARIRDTVRVVGLSRNAGRPAEGGPHQLRKCDLYSLLQVERALTGCDTAVYLVHSMMPSARLTQGNFSDLDLILADNFGRACARKGVRHIVYLGGLIPAGVELSEHLRSRLEVERALGSHGVPVTTLRAGLIIGANGSSFQMLVRLVDRLPAMLCPKWTQTKTQPIALEDVVSLLAYVIEKGANKSRTFDVGGPQVLTYRRMLLDVARLRGRAPVLAPAPLFSPRLSRLWVSLVTGTPGALVGPLVESLQHPMVAANRDLQAEAKIPGIPWETAVRRALQPGSPPQRMALTTKPQLHTPDKIVRSVQRLPRPQGWSATDIAREYLAWLPVHLWPVLRVEVQNDTARFYLRTMRKPLLVLELSEKRSTADRTLFYVRGGKLSDGNQGRLEFRLAPDGRHAVAAVHDFRPSLPWYVYNATQAQGHLWVMRSFGNYLRRYRPTPDRARLQARGG